MPPRSYIRGTAARIAHYAPPGAPDECWEWTGGTCKGYGRIRVDGRMRQAHVVAWELVNGPLPVGVILRHKVCDNRLCCNLAHLEPGSHADNTADKLAHVRHRFGESHGNAKLVEQDVVEMRRLYATGNWTHVQLGAAFGVNRSIAGAVVRRESWKHVA